MSDSEDLMRDQDKIEAYDQLRKRADAAGQPSVNHYIDHLVEENERLKDDR